MKLRLGQLAATRVLADPSPRRWVEQADLPASSGAFVDSRYAGAHGWRDLIRPRQVNSSEDQARSVVGESRPSSPARRTAARRFVTPNFE